MRITTDNIDLWKELVTTMCNLIPGGVVFSTTDLETVNWKVASASFDVPELTIGTRIRTGGAIYNCIQTKDFASEKIPREVYGIRLLMNAIPVFEGEDVAGSAVMILPRLHPIARAFNDFAPIMVEMFPEGATMYMTSLTDFIHRCDSKKFGFADIKVGDPIKDGSPAKEALSTKKMVVKDLPPSFYGLPVQVLTYPLFDEDDPSLVIGTFGMGLPRKTALDLREMSDNLTRSLEEISSVIEQMAASAGQVTTNEQQLNSNISDIGKLSENINEVMGFIKEIADETKMLGLNAAIEAGRAGEVGRDSGLWRKR
jgi:hypothetical protein